MLRGGRFINGSGALRREIVNVCLESEQGRDEECVPRMLRSAISAFTRVFDALFLAAWCAADPGPSHTPRRRGSRLCGAA